MKPPPLILLCLFCATLGFGLSVVFQNEEIAAAARRYTPLIALMLLVALLVVLISVWVGYHLARRWARRTVGATGDMTDSEIIAGLVTQFTTPEGVTDPTPLDRQRATMVNFGMWMARRDAMQFSFNATVTVVGGLVGAATLFLLYEQNIKLDEQNRRITLQTDANITESVLLEGTRRAATAGETVEILNEIRAVPEKTTRECPRGQPGDTAVNCWRWHNQTKDQKKFYMTSVLATRLAAFAQRNSPYFIAQPNRPTIDYDVRLEPQIDLRFVSPERGQLAQTMARNGVDPGTIDFSFADFSGALMNGAVFPNPIFVEADFYRASLRKAFLPEAALQGADARRADMSDAILNLADLSDGKFQGAVLDRAVLNDAVLVGTTFETASLNGASLLNADIREANLTDADLRGAILVGAKFEAANLSLANFGWAQISQADFGGATFDETIFITSWAWSDQLPVGLPVGTTLVICDATQNIRRRLERPDDSLCKRQGTQ